jgi:hypothetical protein
MAHFLKAFLPNSKGEIVATPLMGQRHFLPFQVFRPNNAMNAEPHLIGTSLISLRA